MLAPAVAGETCRIRPGGSSLDATGPLGCASFNANPGLITKVGQCLDRE